MIIAATPSVIMERQQSWHAAGAKHAKPGAAVQRATVTSSTVAPFLPMGIVYATSLDKASPEGLASAVIRITKAAIVGNRRMLSTIQRQRTD